MIKVKAAGVLLDVIENGSIQITKSVQDVESYVDRSGGGYSIPFTMPFTPKNNEFFANYHSVSSQSDGILFDATKKTDVIIEEDGMIVLDGFMQLVGANQTQRVYEVVCFERVISLTDTIRNRRVRDLRLWTAFPHNFTLDNIQDSWTNDLFGGDIVYPVVDYGDRRSNLGGLAIFDYTFRPWIKLKRIFDSILSEAGIRYESNFLTTDPRFTEMYISGANSGIVIDVDEYRFRVVLGEENVRAINTLRRVILGFTFTGGTVAGTSLAEVNEPSTNEPFTGGFFRPLASGRHDMRLFLYIESNNFTANGVDFFTRFPNDITAQVVDQSNGSIVGSLNINIPAAIRNEQVLTPTTVREFVFDFQSINLISGVNYNLEYIYDLTSSVVAFTPNISTVTGETYWEMLAPPNATIGLPIDMAQNAPDMGQLDLVRAVINHFNLMIETDPITPDVVNIEPFNDYYDSGNTIDWTEKIDMSQGVVVKPTTDLQAKFNTWKFSDDNDYFSSKRVLGEFSFESDNEFAQGEQLVELPYGPPPTQTDFPYIITYRIIDEQDGAFSPIDHLPRVGYLRNNSNVIFIRNTSTNTNISTTAAVFAHHVYQNNTPRVLPFSTNANLYNQFFDLTFNSAKNYGAQAGIETNTINNAFTVFWQRYVNEIYNNEARILEAYFSLSPSDINTFRFNDKVFIKDTFYRVLEIQNYTVGERATTKVILLSLTGEALSPFTSCDGVPTGFNADGTVSFSGSNTEQCCNRYGYTFVNGTCRWRPLGGGQIDPPNPTVFLPDLNQPIYGVCCYTPTEGEPSCAQLTELQCLTLNGTWLGPNADCSDCGILVPGE